jgi:hypothetical protein
MERIESVRASIKELILPDLDRISEDSKEIKAILTLTNKRLDDVNLQLANWVAILERDLAELKLRSCPKTKGFLSPRRTRRTRSDFFVLFVTFVV